MTFKQLKNDKWSKGLDDIVCIINRSIDEITWVSMVPENDSYDRGRIRVALFENNKHEQFGLMTFQDFKKEETELHINESCGELESQLVTILDFLKIDLDDLIWQKPSLPFPTVQNWVVMRIDDNGNEFVVSTHYGKGKAERILADFEASHHKQSYWLEMSGTGRCI